MSTKLDAPAASPSARRLAEEKGVDLSSIKGTGPAGKITKGDVTEAVEALGQGGGSPTAPQSSSPPPPSEEASAPDSGASAVAASPVARRLAEEKGIDLAAIQGSGPKGRIVKADVEAFDPAAQPEPAAQPKPTETSPPVLPASSGSSPTEAAGTEFEAPFETQKLTNVRKVIARRLTEAKQTIPHFYLTADTRLDPLLDLRRQLNASLGKDGVKLSVNDLLIKALARALQRVPACNVSYRDGTLLQFSREDISVAVAGPAGLITPVIRDAGGKSLVAVSSEMGELAQKARDGKLQPHEYQGGTASLSNLGMFGIKEFSAVVNPPQGMILAVGAGEKRAIVIDDEITSGTVMSVTGSFDHRAIDGALGAQLMQAFREIVESPFSLLA
ncbi:MAG: 2-oxo acid dehydrogenase subunit E2 [Pseudomonadota bacterium]